MNPMELRELLRLARRLGEEIEVTLEEARAYLRHMGREDGIRDFYLPRVSERFYYDPKVFKKLLGIV